MSSELYCAYKFFGLGVSRPVVMPLMRTSPTAPTAGRTRPTAPTADAVRFRNRL